MVKRASESQQLLSPRFMMMMTTMIDDDDYYNCTYLSITSELPITPTLQISIDINHVNFTTSAITTKYLNHQNLLNNCLQVTLLLLCYKCKISMMVKIQVNYLALLLPVTDIISMVCWRSFSDSECLTLHS